MLRMMVVLVIVIALAAVGTAADLVSMKLCSAKDCAEGTAIQGSAPAGVVHFLTAIRTSEDVDIYHVWIAEGKSTGKVSVYDAATKTLREADASELDWLKQRNIEGARTIVKMTASA